MEGKGQVYNVYVDNQKKLSGVMCGSYTLTGIAEGDHIVKITSVYNGKESNGVTGTVHVNAVVQTTQAPTEAPTTVPGGYTQAGANWTELNYWSVYFASGWGGDPIGGYKNGNSYSNFSAYITKGAAGAAWAVQMKTKEISVVSGKSYTCKIRLNANKQANQILLKDDKSGTEKRVDLVNGTNNLELQFTAMETAQIFFDLANAPDGWKVDITSFELINNEPETTTKEVTTEEPTTEAPTKTFTAFEKIEAEDFDEHQNGVIDNNSNVSGGHNIGGVINGTTMQYNRVNFTEAAGAFRLKYSSPRGVANGRVEIYVDSLSNKVGSIPLANTGSNWETYAEYSGLLDQNISAGMHKIYTKYVTANGAYYVANVDYFRFVKASNTKKLGTGIEINGYQVSDQYDGMRTIYSVDNRINGQDVIASGVVYAVSNQIGDGDLVVGNTNNKVATYESNTSGICKKVYSNSDFATSHAMTMLFGPKTAKEFSSGWKVRAYAKLADGNYVYSNVVSYTIFNVADRLYQNCSMTTEKRHEYLYTNILTKVQPNYTRKAFH